MFFLSPLTLNTRQIELIAIVSPFLVSISKIVQDFEQPKQERGWRTQ